MFHATFKPLLKVAPRVVKKTESRRNDEKSKRGDFLIFVFLMLVKSLSYACSDKPAHLLE